MLSGELPLHLWGNLLFFTGIGTGFNFVGSWVLVVSKTTSLADLSNFTKTEPANCLILYILTEFRWIYKLKENATKKIKIY